MTSGSKYIDFFVHDIIDYTQLVDNNINFTKALSVFEIRQILMVSQTIKEIVSILENHARMKNIEVRTLFDNFD